MYHNDCSGRLPAVACLQTVSQGVGDVYLHEVLLGLINTGNIIKSDACVGLHLELGLRLAKRHWVVATRAANASLGAPRQQEKSTHQQQGKGQVACISMAADVVEME